jgi:predicted DNA-binding transcriptional regulator YafY
MANDEYSEPFFEEDPTGGGEDINLAPEELGQLQALAHTDDIIAPEDQVLPEEIAVSSPLELIPIAIVNSRHLQIEYMNRRGEIKRYIVEPYEIGGNKSHPAGYLWAWDINADQIKSFFLANLSDIQLLETIFVPRF